MIDLDALKRAEGLPPTAANIERVAKATSPEGARWAFKQWELRHKARAKFAKALEMLFDAEALEMATHERVAAYHASLAEGPVTDVTVGIGADLIAFGGGRGYELSPERAEMARHNLKVHGFEAEITVGDCLAHSWSGWVYADPARRFQGKRTLKLEKFAPDPTAIRERMEVGAIKLSPMLLDDELTSLGGVEFVSFRGECREALIRVPETGTWAVHLESGERLEGEVEPDIAEEAGTWLYDADPAAVRAHALGHFGLATIGDHPGYLTGDHFTATPWLTGYRVLSAEPYDPKRLKATLRKHDAGSVVLKQRGAGLDLQDLGKRFKGEGKQPLVLLFWREGKRVWAVVAASNEPLLENLSASGSSL